MSRTFENVSDETAYFHDGLHPNWVLERLENGSAVLRGFHIFRSGSFKDSRGRQQRITEDDIVALADNFTKLRSVFPNVPLRRDHVRSVDNVIGYFDDVYARDGNLYANLTVTEPDAVEKFERGTFRSRSIEVGPYTSNMGDTTAPAVLGLAMVDIPAVEGLFQRYDTTSEESQVAEYTQEELDWALGAAYAQADADSEYDFEADLEWAVAAGFAEAEVAVRAELAKDDDKAPFIFRLGEDEQTSDFAAVQRRLDALVQFHSEQTVKAREGFVDSLVIDNKIGAPQRDDLVEFVHTLTADQFSAFQSTYESAPKMESLGTISDDKGSDSSSNPLVAAYATAQETVAFHKRSGMSDAEIHETQSYKRMLELAEQLENS